MKKKVLGIYCAGGFGGVTLGIANKLNEKDHIWDEIVFIEDDPEKVSDEIILFDVFKEKFPPIDAEIVIAAGEPRTREYLFNKVKEEGYTLPNLIHPWADCPRTVELGEGNIVQTFAYISASGVKIDNNNIIMPITTLSSSMDFVTTAPIPMIASSPIVMFSRNLAPTPT